MRKITTEILVIGGGATGTGLLLDLALRGFKTVLVEKGDISHGTTGRYHGLLHSGCRYVVSDPQSAMDCYEENQILKRIIPFALEDTGGYFVTTPWDDPEYANTFLQGCKNARIPVDEINLAMLRKKEPYLHPEISRCFQVPDASADSFLTSEANVSAASDLGAKIFTYHPVVGLLVNGFHVRGAICHDRENDEMVHIEADIVVSASGAWAGKIAEMAGIKIRMVPGKGTMLAINHRIVNSVINRCKYPADGDIIVPAHTVSVLGTTDHPVPDPDNFTIEPWEVDRIITEGEKLLPALRNYRFLRAWAGVRPLIKVDAREENQIGSENLEEQDTRELSRMFVLLDHETRDGVTGLVTITCGKWTTYRKMAEVTADLVCEKLRTHRPCKTQSIPLSSPSKKYQSKIKKNRFLHLDDRLRNVENQHTFGSLICECELVSREEIVYNLKNRQAKSLDDLRRDTRLGMGPCQGGFCTIRAVGIMNEIDLQPIEWSNQAIVDFITERWYGIQPVLWGQQLRQQNLDYFIFSSLLSVDQLQLPEQAPFKPEKRAGRFGDDEYRNRISLNLKSNSQTIKNERFNKHPKYDVIVIGGGLTGLSAAWMLSKFGVRTCLLTEGWGALYWHTGCIDIYGKDNPLASTEHQPPIDSIRKIRLGNREHPYAHIDESFIMEIIDEFKQLFSKASYPFHGSLEHQFVLPTCLGSTRPSCLIPETMLAGDCSTVEQPVLITGFKYFNDFYPKLMANNLMKMEIMSGWCEIDLSDYLDKYHNSHPISVTSARLAHWFDQDEFCDFFLSRMEDLLNKNTHQAFMSICIPAVLGIKNVQEIFRKFRKRIGLPVFEVPILPPSIPGMRIAQILINEIRKSGGKVFEGMKVISSQVENRRVVSVIGESASGNEEYSANSFILATGGILGGGFFLPYHEKPHEIIFGIPVTMPESNEILLKENLGKVNSPLFNLGFKTNDWFQPVDTDGELLFENLWCAGTGLFGGDYINERSFEGVGLFSGTWVSKLVMENQHRG